MSPPLRDILSVRLENRATLLRMIIAGEGFKAPRAVREVLGEIAEDLKQDARLAGLLELGKGRSV